jgi:subtilisin family serine protease
MYRLLLLLFLTLSVSAAAQEFHHDRLILALSPSARADAWIEAGRSGSIKDIEGIVGPHTTTGYLSTSVLVALDRARSNSSLRKISETIDPLALIVEVHFDGERDIQRLTRKLATLDDVRYAEPLPIHRIVEDPNDPFYPQQQHLPLIRATEAWAIAKGLPTVVVGIIDTGLDTLHPDLNPMMYRHPGETGIDAQNRDKRYNKVDDDGNGFVDDWFGWDFWSSSSASGDNAPLPGNPHGTHVAGIIGAAIDNAVGVCGVAPNVQLLPVKVGSDDEAGRTVSRAAEAILYAAAIGARIINCSFGSPSQSFAEVEVIEAATELGSLIVGAAGNDGEILAFYPASYPMVLSVTSTNGSDEISMFSNLHSSVDVAAPGENVLSTYPGSIYSRESGTSMASPVVAGIAAMVAARHPEFVPDEVRATVCATATNIDAKNIVWKGLFGSGRVDAASAVEADTVLFTELERWAFADDNNDGINASGERIQLSTTLYNIASDVRDVEIDVEGTHFEWRPTFERSTVMVGAISHADRVDAPEAIVFTLPSDLPLNVEIPLLVTVRTGTTVLSRREIRITANATFRTLAHNDLQVTVNSTGNLGYNDYPTNTEGVGIRWRNSKSLTYEGALMVATSPNALSNVARGTFTDQKDTAFRVREVVTIKTDSVQNGIRAITMFDDSLAQFNAQVSVREQVLQSADDSVRSSIVVCYDVTSLRDVPSDSFFVALFFDWDIGTAGADNRCAWNGQEGFAYQNNVLQSSGPIVAVSMISPLPINMFAVDNGGQTGLNPGIYDSFLRNEKWFMMSTGINRTISNVTDASMVIGAGPFHLDPGQTQQVCFAIAVHNNGDSLIAAMRSARAFAMSNGVNAAAYVPQPSEARIERMDPYPLVSGTTIDVQFSVDRTSTVLLDVYDVLGRHVETVYDGDHYAGIYTRTVNIGALAGGNYILRMSTFAGSDAMPFSVAR